MLSDYSFGNLVLSVLFSSISSKNRIQSDKLLEENSDPDFSAKQAQDLGKIQITIQRVKLAKKRASDLPDTRPIATIKGVPEKALKGRSIENTVEYDMSESSLRCSR